MFGFVRIGRLREAESQIETLKASLARAIADADAETDRAADLEAKLGECEARWRKECRKAGEAAEERDRLRVACNQAEYDLSRLRRDRLAEGLRSGGVVTSRMVDGW